MFLDCLHAAEKPNIFSSHADGGLSQPGVTFYSDYTKKSSLHAHIGSYLHSCPISSFAQEAIIVHCAAQN